MFDSDWNFWTFWACIPRKIVWTQLYFTTLLHTVRATFLRIFSSLYFYYVSIDIRLIFRNATGISPRRVGSYHGLSKRKPPESTLKNLNLENFIIPRFDSHMASLRSIREGAFAGAERWRGALKKKKKKKKLLHSRLRSGREAKTRSPSSAPPPHPHPMLFALSPSHFPPPPSRA